MSSVARPFGAGVADPVPDGRLRADVHAPRGVRGDQHAGAGLQLAADDELLLVAAGQRAGQRVRPGGTDVVLAHDPRGVVPREPAPQEAAAEQGV